LNFTMAMSFGNMSMDSWPRTQCGIFVAAKQKVENNGHAEADFDLPVHTSATILSCLALL
jgi:hypothetical protein